MAELSLYLTNANVSLGQTMEPEKVSGDVSADFETVDIVEPAKKVKTPRRTIYFASGETMEEFSTDDEEEDLVKKEVLPVDPSKLTLGPFFWFQMWRMATSTVSVCDYMGEKLASLFGITTPKYQYAIDEYYRIKKEEEEEEEENRLADEAEMHFSSQRRGEQDDQTATVQQPETSASFVNISFEQDPDRSAQSSETNRVPSPLPS